VKILRLVGLLALIGAVTACSEHTVPSPPTDGVGGTDGTGGRAGTGGSGGRSGAGGAGGVGGIGASGGAAGEGGTSGAGGTGGLGGATGSACINDSDLQVIQMTTPSLRWQAANCAVSFEGAPDDEAAFLTHMNTCLEGSAPGLSAQCTTCYAELAWCAGDACNSWCSMEPGNGCSPECTTDSPKCLGYDACLTNLNQCAGRDSLDCLGDT
jgi:hypothetical protein